MCRVEQRGIITARRLSVKPLLPLLPPCVLMLQCRLYPHHKKALCIEKDGSQARWHPAQPIHESTARSADGQPRGSDGGFGCSAVGAECRRCRFRR